MGKSEAVAPADKAFPVAGIYLFGGIGNGGGEEVSSVFQYVEKLGWRTLSGFLEHVISGKQCSMMFHHLQIFLRAPAVFGPVARQKELP